MLTSLSTDSAASVRPSFPLVGIGASAGGLEALSDFFGALPGDTGAAFLIVQHLDPSHESLLPGILATRTEMEVVEAVDGMQVGINRVYVIPPNTRMLVNDWKIHLEARGNTLGPPMPIDDLFDSLAAHEGQNGIIGVVLSGGGSDGALGLRALQREGGITFAQDEESAKFSSMPQAAVAAGCVDFVLKPREIAAEIGRIAALPSQPSRDDVQPDAEALEGPALRRIFRLLQSACTIDFTHYKRGTVERRLARRMALRQLTSLAEYRAVLEEDPAETLALGRDLLIRVTEFFRDPETFDTLVQSVFPRILGATKVNRPIRIWVPGCASGEEVYSLAICLAEYLGPRLSEAPVQIFGTDVSLEALEVARTGRYIENIARNVSAERLSRYFVRDGEYFRIDKSLRDMCTFARHNVAEDPPFSRMDLVSCRNLLIYLDPVLQARVLPLFHYALRTDGVLMLGPSESVGAFSEYFGVLEDASSKVYIRKPRPSIEPSLPGTIAARAHGGANRHGASAREQTHETQLRTEADRQTLGRYAPPGVVCDSDLNILMFRGDTSGWLSNPDGPPSMNLQKLARPEIFLAATEAINRVRQSGAPARRTGLRVNLAGSDCAASVEAHPIKLSGIDSRWFLVFFEANIYPSVTQRGFADAPLRALILQLLQQRVGQQSAHTRSGKDEEIARLTNELAATRERLRAALEEHESAREELKSSEEELLSSNEEFRSTNEELETAKEELQSINEELSTTNDELRYRVRELKDLHTDVAGARDFAEGIIETTAQPILVLDGGLRVKRANAAFCQMFSTTVEGTAGSRLYALGNGQWDIPALRELLENVLPRHSAVRDYEIVHAFPRIGLRTMRLNARRLDWSGQGSILLTIEDVTRQRADFARLHEADRQKDEFLAMLGHELRNPLAAIRSGLLVWQRGTADAVTVRQVQASVQRQLDHEIGLVDDLLDVSRITRGVIVVKSVQIDLAEPVRHAIQTLSPLADLQRHELTLRLPPSSLIVTGDPLRLEQIVSNLLANAIKYTPDGGHIALTLERQGHEAVITLTDDGIGIKKEVLSPIFDIFVQADSPAERRQSGLGLGLALVRKLVELHGGTVHATSPGPNQGSTFVVRLPVLPHGTLADRPSKPVEIPSAPTSRRILLVDDNNDAAQSTAALLQLDGHEVRIAADGTAALASVEEFRPEVILLDIGLPDMDGYEVARRIREMPEQTGVLVVALSGYGLPATGHHRQGAIDHYMVKPADYQKLNALISRGRQ